MKVQFTLSIGYPSAKQKEVVELDDDLADDDIEEAYETWKNNFLDGGWERVN